MITLDLESRSYADLPKVGAWAYSEDPTTEVICSCWGIEDNPIQHWWDLPEVSRDPPGDLDELFYAVKHGELIEAHNVAFEYSMWHNILHPRHGWPLPKDDQWRDTMAVACYYSLPASLDRLTRVLGYGGKDPEGGRLITKYSKLFLKTAKKVIPDHEWVEWRDMTKTERDKHPEARAAGGYYNEDFSFWVYYCDDDVKKEQSVSDELGDLPERELPYFLSSMRRNIRGLHLDRPGIRAAHEVVSQRAEELTEEFNRLTGLNPTQGKAIHTWTQEHGVTLDNLQKDYLEELLDEGDLPSGPVREALDIRIRINKASTKKLDAMERQVGADGRARWQTRYHGASTGRSTASGIQVLNLNKGYEDVDPEQLVRDIVDYKDPNWLDMLYEGGAMEAVGKASRHWITAEPGNKIVAGDFVSVEAVILACMAGEDWKIKAFRDGVKIYEHMADKIYNLAPGTVTKATHPLERHDGKTGELAFGYQGALGAWLKFDNSGRHSDERIIEICRGWRREHPRTVGLWAGLEDAAIEAVLHPGRTTGYRDIGFERVDEWLTMILPNGKRLWYWKPYLKETMPQWHKPMSKDDCAAGTCKCRPRLQLHYWSTKDGVWKVVGTYGGKLTENACQATSREIIMPAALRVENAGYHVILDVYDELVAEVPSAFGSTREFEELMTPVEDWCSSWPIRVDAWEGQRYKK